MFKLSPPLSKKGLFQRSLIFGVLFILLDLVLGIIIPKRAPFPFDRWYSYHPTVGWAPKEIYFGPVLGEIRKFWTDGFLKIDIPDIQNTKDTKVLVAGDSLAHGYGVGARDTYSELLQQRIKDHVFINIGVAGHSIIQTYQYLKEKLPKAAPHLLIVNSSFNNRRAITVFQGHDSLFNYFKNYIWNRITRYVTIFRIKETEFKQFEVIKKPSRTPLQNLIPRVPLPTYKKYIHKIIQLARRYKTPIVFILYATPPKRLNLLNEIDGLIGEKKYDEVIKFFQGERPNIWNALFDRQTQIKMYQKLGNALKAKEVSEVTVLFKSLHGGRPLIRAEVYNKAMSEIAQKEGIPVIDPNGHLDDSCFNDSIGHYSQNGHQILAKLIFEKLSSSGLLKARVVK